MPTGTYVADRVSAEIQRGGEPFTYRRAGQSDVAVYGVMRSLEANLNVNSQRQLTFTLKIPAKALTDAGLGDPIPTDRLLRSADSRTYVVIDVDRRIFNGVRAHHDLRVVG